MAKIKKGILGAFSGKVGPVIGGMWKNIAYIRAVSKTGTSPKRTPGQIATQEKMRFINTFLMPFHNYIRIGLKNEAENQTEISVAFKANYHESIIGRHPNLNVDFSKFIFSKGNLPMVKNMVVILIEDTLQFTWEFDASSLGRFNDQLMIVVYSPKLKNTTGFIGGIDRRAKKCSFQLNERFRGKPIEVYASITSLDRKRIANNVYLGRLAEEPKDLP